MENGKRKTWLFGSAGMILALILTVSGCSNPTASSSSSDDSDSSTPAAEVAESTDESEDRSEGSEDGNDSDGSDGSDSSAADDDSENQESDDADEDETSDDEVSGDDQDPEGDKELQLDYETDDVGEAGGLIFHVTDDETGDTVYYEAAPEDLVTDSGEAVFTWDTADELANRYAPGDNNEGGWRLPGNDELEAMYTNLHQDNKGNFEATIYWADRPGQGNSPVRHWLSFNDGTEGEWNSNSSDGEAPRYRARAVREIELD